MARKKTKVVAHKKCTNICIIHHSSINLKLSENLIKLDTKDNSSWLSLLRAAHLRKHEGLLKIAKDLQEGEVPELFYHKQCRSRFTMKRDREKLEKEESGVESDKLCTDGSIAPPRKSIRVAPSTSTVYDTKCIFCKRHAKHITGTDSKEYTIKCTDLRSDKTLRELATARRDQNILAILSREIVAAEAHYHRSCYRNYGRESHGSTKSGDSHDSTVDESHLYNSALNSAYQALYTFIRNDVFSNAQVLDMNYFKAKLTDLMKENGFELSQYSKKDTKRRLQAEFQDSLHFVNYNYHNPLVYPDNLALDKLVCENHELKTELKHLKEASSKDDVLLRKAAEFIKTDIKQHEVKISWPPQPKELQPESVILPEKLSLFLKTLLSADKECSAKVECVLKSLGQDLIFAITKQLTAKHILLPYTVKSLTGNVELIKILNRLGHSISYSLQEEIDTALCMQKLARTSEGNIPLPESLVPHVTAMLAYDNIDRLEETLSGKGTSHRVNGIAVQPVVYGPEPEKPALPVIVKSKQRTINIENSDLPIYNAGQRSNPPIRNVEFVPNFNEKANDSKKKNLIWILARNHSSESQVISAWTGFNIKVTSNQNPTADKVSYLPTVNAPATELSTVYECLQQAVKIQNALYLKEIFVWLDQALYAKAYEVICKNPIEFSSVILGMGIFHDIGTLLAIIGKRFEDSGIQDIFTEAGIVAEGSITKVMTGKMYNRAIRAHKLLYEGLMRLAWKAFIPWFEQNYANDQIHMDEVLDIINNLCGNLCEDTFKESLESIHINFIFDAFEKFLSEYSKSEGLVAFWISYLDMVELLFSFLRASREGNWELHLWGIREMLPWCFAYDRTNYARYLSVYYRDMLLLEQDHPDIYNFFMEGRFSVQMSSTNTFGRIPMDQTTEETVNRDTQTPGGTKGFSLKPGAISRYYLTAEYRSIFLHNMRAMVEMKRTSYSHHDLQKARINRDEKDVATLIDMIENWINPFEDKTKELVSLSTASVATSSIKHDLLKAKELGESAYLDFNKRLEPTDTNRKFYDTLPKLKLKTFANLMKKAKTVKSGPKEIILKADRNLFAHMIILAQNRKISMKEVLSHPLGPLPWSLATADGSLRKTNKATLARELEKNALPASLIPDPSACIIDGMAIVQKIAGDHKSFAEVANIFLNVILREAAASGSLRIDIVFDVYRDRSIKDAERSRRSTGTPALHYKNIVAGHKIQQWRKFLSAGENKSQLIIFIVKYVKQKDGQSKLGQKTLYITCGAECFRITKNSVEKEVNLSCSHEEADTRLLFHSEHASNSGYNHIVINSEDTDVFLIALYFSTDIPATLYMRCGTQNKARYVNITKIGTVCGESFCKALLGLHSFTGCDSVSAFAGRGKLNAFKLVKSNPDLISMFTRLGNEAQLPDELMPLLEKFTCDLYSSKTKEINVNELRYKMFCARKGELESHQLPPCLDTLAQHSKRANYQSHIWQQSLVAFPEIPSPVGYGWILEDEILEIDWMTGNPAPDDVLEFLSCKCSRSCQPGKCICILNGLKCTDMCSLKTCQNQTIEEDEMNASDFSDSDDSSDEE